MTKQRRRQPEAQDQRALVQHLEARAVPGLVWFHVPQGNKLGGKISAKGIAIQGAINRGLGVKRGVSDLIFLHDARFYALEIKAEGRTPTAEQLEFIDKVNAAGGFACWCAGLDHALAILEGWKLLRGRSQVSRGEQVAALWSAKPHSARGSNPRRSTTNLQPAYRTRPKASQPADTIRRPSLAAVATARRAE